MGEGLGLSPEEMGLPEEEVSLEGTKPEPTQKAIEQERDNDGGDPDGGESGNDSGSEGASSQTELANTAAKKISAPKSNGPSVGHGSGPGVIEAGGELISSIADELPNAG